MSQQNDIGRRGPRKAIESAQLPKMRKATKITIVEENRGSDHDRSQDVGTVVCKAHATLKIINSDHVFPLIGYPRDVRDRREKSPTKSQISPKEVHSIVFLLCPSFPALLQIGHRNRFFEKGIRSDDYNYHTPSASPSAQIILSAQWANATEESVRQRACGAGYQVGVN